MTDRPPIPDLVLQDRVIAIGRNIAAAERARRVTAAGTW